MKYIFILILAVFATGCKTTAPERDPNLTYVKLGEVWSPPPVVSPRSSYEPFYGIPFR